MKKNIDVVGAAIESQGTILCAQRGSGGQLAGKWEFPGGKVEHEETPRQALEREISEELACGITVGDEVTTTRHEYDFAVVTLTTFWCELVEGAPTLSEHSAISWVPADELSALDWAPADLPAVQVIRKMRG